MIKDKVKIKTFKDLNAWQEGHKLVLLVYKATRNFPNTETFGLTNQLRRSIVSFTSNIAEGFSRISYRDKVHFYSMALGSLTEAENQLIIAHDVGYLNQKDHLEISELIIIVHKITNGLIKKSKMYS